MEGAAGLGKRARQIQAEVEVVPKRMMASESKRCKGEFEKDDDEAADGQGEAGELCSDDEGWMVGPRSGDMKRPLTLWTLGVSWGKCTTYLSYLSGCLEREG